LTVNIRNGPGSVSAIAFTDNYPAGLVNAATPTLSNTCNGTATGAANDDLLSLSGGSLGSNRNCAVAVSVTASSCGNYVNPNISITASSGSATAAAATLTVVGSSPSATISTVVASPTTVVADGVAAATLTVTLLDACGNPIAGKTVTLTASGGHSTITPASASSSASGVATFTVRDATPDGAITYSAKDTTDNVTLTQTAQVTFLGPVSASASTVVASPTTVVADNSTGATITVTLKDSAGHPMANKSVTLAAGSGSSIITTLSGTTNASGVATFSVKDGSPEAITYTATDSTDGITITQTALVTFTPTLCFYESFAGSGVPSSYWSIGSQSGSFTPALVNNRLRLTDNGLAEANWVTLNKFFPAAGNSITVVFDHYAYGGSGGTGGANSGGDGIAVILSDASVAPAAGAFGGSLGYAPKSNPGSDCTQVGGCPGFAGGWMGTALDEYGNFQNPTEGRYGGVGQVSESVSIRGSGSGMSGYRYIAGTATLSPGIDRNNTANPPYRYRITIDHTDSLHAWISVERDTTGGGTSFQTLLGATGCATSLTSGCFDIEDPGYSQRSLPSNWRLSLTGSSGAASNTHEIANLQVCSAQNIVTPTLHHLELDHTGQGCTGSANPASIVLKACADSACTALYLGSVTATLSASPVTGTAWSSNPVTFSGGSTTVTLSDTNANTVTLGATATNPTTGNASQCYVGAAQTCSLTFSSCRFDVVEPGENAFAPIYTKLAGDTFLLDVLSLLGSSQTVTKFEIVDASQGTTCSGYTALPGAITPPGSTFTSMQRKSNQSFQYGNAVANARIRVTTGAGVFCSSDNFAIRPKTFTLAAYNASNALLATTQTTTTTPIVKAGALFKITADTGFSAYTGQPKLNAGPISTPLPYLGTLATTTFPAAVAGVSTASSFAYSEVGNFTLGANAVYDDSFAAVDSNKAQPECTSDFSNTANANGEFGCMFGNTAALSVGRFVPDHLQTTTGFAQGCSSGGFTYSGQPFTVGRVDALNSGGSNTLNYSNATGYAKAVSLCGAASSDSSGNCSASSAWSLANGSIAASSFAAGLGYSGSATPTISFITTPTAPSAINVRATDSDGVTSASHEGQLLLRSGWLRLGSYTGAAGTSLQLPVTAYYWSGNAWTKNSNDSCTVIPSAAVALSGYLTGTSAAGSWTTTASGTSLAAGYGYLTLAAPAPSGSTGSVSVALNLGSTTADSSCLASHPATTGAGLAFLRGKNGNCAASTTYAADPAAVATFGIYSPESSKVMYMRELH
jgi:MSHA biogenesis protein MshQ